MATQGDDIDLDAEHRLAGMGSSDLLERVAFTLGATLDLKEVLRRLGEMVHQAASAQRCSIVLIEGERLKPAVAISAHPDDDLWSAFRSMPPIELGPDEWLAIRRGRALAFEDARESPFIPQSWVDRFSLRAVALVPLLAHGEPCGVMALDWPEIRPIDRQELAVIEAIGTYAGLAIHNARLHDRVARKSRTLEHLVEVAGALNSSSSLDGVLDRVCDGFDELLGAVHTSVNLIDPAEPLRVRTIATRGDESFARRPGRADPLPPEELVIDDDLWRDTAGPVVYPRVSPADDSSGAGPSSVRSAALFPLFGPDGLIGSVVAGFPHLGGPASDDLDTGQTLAELAAAAISRADLHEQLRRRVRQLEILSGLSDVVAGTAGLDVALVHVDDALGDLDLDLLSIAVPSESLRAVIGGREPDADEAAAIRGWQAVAEGLDRPLGLRLAGSDLLVPVAHHRQVQGVLRVGNADRTLSLPDEEFLMAIGSACAEVIYRAGLARALHETESRLTIAAERERIAQDLHDSAGGILTGMGLQLADYSESAPEPWRTRLAEMHALAKRGEREMREAVYSLLFVQVRQDGLAKCLEDLAERFETTTGIAVTLAIEGDALPLGSAQEEALFRVAHEALANVERHAEASNVAVRLDFRGSHATLTVQDDGVGLSREAAEAGHVGLHALSRKLLAAGGTLQVGGGEGSGVRVEASVPVP